MDISGDGSGFDGKYYILILIIFLGKLSEIPSFLHSFKETCFQCVPCAGPSECYCGS